MSHQDHPFSAPQLIDAQVLTTLPEQYRQPRSSPWGDANRGGVRLHSFLEGPAFDREGNLYVVDIPFGRIFRISPSLQWELVLEYDGWPNGLAIHRDGDIWIADYKHGLLILDPTKSTLRTHLGHNRTESFRGVNDLSFSLDGDCLFTDQGQTGLHDATGKVYRLHASQGLETLLSNVPSPNGLVLDEVSGVLYVAATRANNIWRVPLVEAWPSKVGVFQTFFGPGGPDGLAMDSMGQLVVAHASLGGAVLLARNGAISHFIRGPSGCVITNLAFRPGSGELILTDAQHGHVLTARLPTVGATLFSHST